MQDSLSGSNCVLGMKRRSGREKREGTGKVRRKEEKGRRYRREERNRLKEWKRSG